MVAKYGVRPTSTPTSRRCAATRPTGCPASPASARRAPQPCCATYGDLDGIIAAAADPASDLAKGPRAKILAAADYLEVAPAVVDVVRDLELPEFDARIREFSPEARPPSRALSEQWGLSSSMERAVKSLSAVSGRRQT